jgi:magnesium chelatase family protein
VPCVAYHKLTDARQGETSEKVRACLEAAREKHPLRFLTTGLASNGDTRCGPADVRAYFKLDDAGTSLMRMAMSQLQLSARNFHRVLKLERTTVALADSETIQRAHLAEALQYRPRQ